MQWTWTLIRQECTGCGICADVCTYEAVRMNPEMPYPDPVPSRCVGCMACVEQCPFDAVEVRELTASPARSV